MKNCAIVLIMFVAALAGATGCNKDGPEKKNLPDGEKAPNEKKAAAARYESIAVMPFTTDVEFSKPRYERELPEAVAREIARKRPDSLIVIAPAVVQEKRRPDMDLKEFGRVLGAKTLLIGKANGANIDFQLIVAETGGLLWGESFNSGVKDLDTTLADRVVAALTR
jgi:TolB-like protein